MRKFTPARNRSLARSVLVAVAAMAVAALAFLAAEVLLPGLPGWAGRHLPFAAGRDLVAWVQGLGAVGLAGAAFAAVRAWGRRWQERRSAVDMRMPSELRVDGWVVDRPLEVAQVVEGLLRRRHAGLAGVTPILHGAGGFGKTTLAKVVCADRRVRRRFGGRVYLVTLGRDMQGNAAIVEKVNDVIKLVSGEDATFTDADLAGQWLGSLLDDGPRRLLVLDDVWSAEQLAPFVEGGRQCARLVTTRNPGVLTGRGMPVLVGQMSVQQARTVLTFELPRLTAVVVDGLLGATGRWPLLLRLVNKILVDAVRAGADVSATGADLCRRLRADGPAAADRLLSTSAVAVNLDNPTERARTVRATIEASIDLLAAGDRQRFSELAIFAEDETFPVRLIAVLWRVTGQMDELQSRQSCTRLADLALVTLTPDSGGMVSMHHVVRDYLRQVLGSQRLIGLHQALLDELASKLPSTGPLPAGITDEPRPAWWQLDDRDRYLWDHLVEHLLGGDRMHEAEAVAEDLRWAGARLMRSGPAAPYADLSLIATERAARMRRAWARTSHLLLPTIPVDSIVDILHTHLGGDRDWGPQVTALRAGSNRSLLVNRWPMPDLTDPALRRTMLGDDAGRYAVAIAPDGSWVAVGSGDGIVRIWDAASGNLRFTLVGHTSLVTSVAISSDGSWLATGGAAGDATVRIWDAATGQQRAKLGASSHGVNDVAIAPDDTWLATCGDDQGIVRIWDAVTWQQRLTLPGRTGSLSAIAIAPDGTWLATGSDDQKTVRIWDVATGTQRTAFAGLTGWLHVLAISPDGTWLATGCGSDSVQLRDTATGQPRATLAADRDHPHVGVHGQAGHAGEVRSSTAQSVAIAPDGTWLATGHFDSAVRIWDAATGQQRATLTGHTGEVRAVAIAPDGTWLATCGGLRDGTVRIWDTPTDQPLSTLSGHTSEVLCVAIAPDGTWLATNGDLDSPVRIWNAATGQHRPIARGHAGEMFRWRSLPTAPGSPPVAATAQCEPGIRPPANSN